MGISYKVSNFFQSFINKGEELEVKKRRCEISFRLSDDGRLISILILVGFPVAIVALNVLIHVKYLVTENFNAKKSVEPLHKDPKPLNTCADIQLKERNSRILSFSLIPNLSVIAMVFL